ncbi:hypothetical protein KFK09_006886 [Dendrobium nobile]|uniref:BHLH domain-containing protein n=3 Tax=Dendrobium TaxID=37818 RepID=A0A8T3BQR2_DENNO|nr:hypothetical protein KFK09_006886 [Dendrobium nobile]
MFPFLPESHDESNYGPPEMMISPTVASASLPGYFMASFFPMEMAGATRTDHIPLDRAVVASRNHREAEKRRRERIKSHLDRLRAILSCDPKTDKASLLAKAVEHVRDLKQRIAEISQAQLFPTETDEISVLPGSLHSTSLTSSSEGGRRTVFEASVCCDDRSDLLPELIETLRTLRMKTLRAEMATLGGRVRNVLVLTRENDEEYDEGVGVVSDEDGGGLIREALMSVVNRPVPAVDRSKRRRIVDNTDMYV